MYHEGTHTKVLSHRGNKSALDNDECWSSVRAELATQECREGWVREHLRQDGHLEKDRQAISGEQRGSGAGRRGPQGKLIMI